MCKEIQQKPVVYVIAGPTASGKTALSIELAKRVSGEIISADSIQVYKGLDIGSAKPTIEERAGIAHHMIDVAEVSRTDFSVAEYKTMASRCIEDVLARNKAPIVVGGSGLYINALTCPLTFTNVVGNETVRKQLRAQEAAVPGSLHKALQEIDPLRATQIHKNDTKRLVRAMEIHQISGEPPSTFGESFIDGSGSEMPYDYRMCAISQPREQLYTRIDRRVDDMLKMGFLDEVESLHSQQFSPDLPALQALGYRQLLRYFRGETTLEEAIALTKRETRRFAKRQLTWFRRDSRIKWMAAEEIHNFICYNE